MPNHQNFGDFDFSEMVDSDNTFHQTFYSLSEYAFSTKPESESMHMSHSPSSDSFSSIDEEPEEDE